MPTISLNSSDKLSGCASQIFGEFHWGLGSKELQVYLRKPSRNWNASGRRRSAKLGAFLASHPPQSQSSTST